MDGLILKKMVASVLYPLPVCLALLFAGVVLLWTRKRQVCGRTLVTLGGVLLLVFSLPPLPGVAVRTLERKYAPYTPPSDSSRAAAWVVVLGGGTTDAPALPVNQRLSRPSLERLVEGVRVLRLHPEALLLLCGGRLYDDRAAPEAAVMRDMAVSLGVDPQRIRLEDRSRDTADQALYVRAIVGGDALVLVTSALHMPRAMALFRKQGLAPVPAPTGYLITPDPGTAGRGPFDFAPGSDDLEWLKAAWHERLGMLWARLQGQI